MHCKPMLSLNIKQGVRFALQFSCCANIFAMIHAIGAGLLEMTPCRLPVVIYNMKSGCQRKHPLLLECVCVMLRMKLAGMSRHLIGATFLLSASRMQLLTIRHI